MLFIPYCYVCHEHQLIGFVYVLGFSNDKSRLLGDVEVWIYAAELSELDHIGRVSQSSQRTSPETGNLFRIYFDITNVLQSVFAVKKPGDDNEH